MKRLALNFTLLEIALTISSQSLSNQFCVGHSLIDVYFYIMGYFASLLLRKRSACLFASGLGLHFGRFLLVTLVLDLLGGRTKNLSSIAFRSCECLSGGLSFPDLPASLLNCTAASRKVVTPFP